MKRIRCGSCLAVLVVAFAMNAEAQTVDDAAPSPIGRTMRMAARSVSGQAWRPGHRGRKRHKDYLAQGLQSAVRHTVRKGYRKPRQCRIASSSQIELCGMCSILDAS
jgi:hypothetical protein